MREKIGLKILELRNERNITQEDVSSRLNMTRQRYSRIEKGLSDLSYDLILKISEIFNVDPLVITQPESNHDELVKFFRANQINDEVTQHVSRIEEILKLIYAHERLYHRMQKEENHDEI
jgi:transcriptional regulator with XRE-family HTH domain